MAPKAWTFITSHGGVLALMAQHGQITAKDIADTLGMTERPVRKVISDLAAAGYIERTRVGTVNYYKVNKGLPLRLAGARDTSVGELLNVLKFRSPEERST